MNTTPPEHLNVDSDTLTVYHGSTENLTIIGKGHCVCATADYPLRFALGKIPGSKGYGQNPGWIYVLRVRSEQIEKSDLDYVLLEDITPEQKLEPSAFKPKTAVELLYGETEAR